MHLVFAVIVKMEKNNSYNKESQTEKSTTNNNSIIKYRAKSENYRPLCS